MSISGDQVLENKINFWYDGKKLTISPQDKFLFTGSMLKLSTIR